VTPLLKPWQLMLLTLAGWINRSQQEAIEYLRAENQVLAEQLKGRRRHSRLFRRRGSDHRECRRRVAGLQRERRAC
jgi:hypothetical protein